MKTTLVALLLTVFLVPALSHAHGSDHKHGTHMLDRMSRELNLTDEQHEQVKTVMRNKRDRQRELREETRAQLNDILDAGQQQKMEAMKAERKAKWQNRRSEWKAGKSAD